jgi:tetratricopeptide (TPR) repeat protein
MSTLEGIVALSEQSLLREREDFDGEPRFWMLETIRAYAAERLADSGEEERIAAAHVDYFARFAREAEPHWRDPDEGRWAALFDGEIDNLRAAIEHAASTGDPATALEMTANLTWLWHGGYAREGERLLRELRASASSASPSVRAYAHAAQLILQRDNHLLDEGETQQAVDACIVTGRRDVGEFLRLTLADQQCMRGETAQAQVLVALAEAMVAETDDQGVASVALEVQAYIFLEQGQPAAAREVLLRLVEHPHSRSNTSHLISDLSSLCELELAEGNADEAAEAAERALQLARETNNREVLPYALARVGQAALLHGDLDQADDHLRHADHVEREVRPSTERTSFFLEEIRLTRAALAAAQGDTERARNERDTALKFFEEHHLTVPPAARILLKRYPPN